MQYLVGVSLSERFLKKLTKLQLEEPFKKIPDLLLWTAELRRKTSSNNCPYRDKQTLPMWAIRKVWKTYLLIRKIYHLLIKVLSSLLLSSYLPCLMRGRHLAPLLLFYLPSEIKDIWKDGIGWDGDCILGLKGNWRAHNHSCFNKSV